MAGMRIQRVPACFFVQEGKIIYHSCGYVD